MNTRKKVARRNYKDAIFRRVFQERGHLLGLYNAVNDSHYTDVSALRIVTLENAIYMSMKNDVAFMLDNRLSLYEHQSSFNPNMPLRNLLYLSCEYEKLINNESIYSQVLIKLPTPRFLVFYNGMEPQPERRELLLSDAFEIRDEVPALELRTIQLNINPGYNQDLMEKCPLLWEYSQYVARVRKYAKELPLEEAVELAVEECIQDNILKDFLMKNRSEAIKMSIFEYDEEKEMILMKKSLSKHYYEKGHEQGLSEGKSEGLSLALKVMQMYHKGISSSEIATALQLDTKTVQDIIENLQTLNK